MATTAQKPLKNFYLTEEGLKTAKFELAYLKTQKRAEIALRISRALEFGNLDENSDYDAALNEQSVVEIRILELEEIIRGAKIIRHQGKITESVVLGSTVTIKMYDDIEEYTIVGKLETNPSKKRVSNESPIGAALIGARIGDEVLVKTPTTSYKCKVLEIK